MTDPERISKRSTGLAAQLLRAGAEEQPSDVGVEQTLAALGVSGAILTTTTATSAAGAAAGGAKLTGAVSAGTGGAAAAGGTAKAVSAMALVKWIGIGVVGGMGLAGAAAVATGPSSAPSAVVKTVVSLPQPRAVAAPSAVVVVQAPVVADAPAPESAPVAAMPAPHLSVVEPVAPAPVLEVGAPLAAEVAFVDRARSLLATGQTEQGLAMLGSYERQFPEARLLPEVLFLKLETCDRLGRFNEARAAAQRLLEGFPKSPHASRARKLLQE